MNIFRDSPIKRKLTLITMLTSGIALLLACTAFVIYEHVTFRDTLVRDFAILADIFDDNVAPGLAFNDPASIKDVLKSFKAHPHVLAAAVYDKTGKVAARYQRSNLEKEFRLPPIQGAGFHWEQDRLDTFQPITLAGERIGTLYIAADLTDFTDRLKRYAFIGCLVLLVSSLVAFGLSAKLQRIISEPISHLLQVTNVVATEKNFSVRAVKRGEDELGRLIEGFNEMLDQIQQRDSAVEAARAGLEERTRELGRSLSLLNATLDSTADGILAVELTGKVNCHNTKFATMWGIPSEMLARRDGAEMVSFIAAQATNSEQFLEQIRGLQAGAETEAFDVFALKDGRIFERYIQPQKVDGTTVGLVINFRDITERRQAEEVLDDLNKRLLLSSRMAGMSEVATSVLHNVGNVLNSVSVSAEVVAERVRQSRAGNLKNVAILLREHRQDLAEFFTHDPKGRELPDYLLKLADHLAEPQKAILQEVESLKKNIEHIKEVVTMQQSYARVSGVWEAVSVVELIEDAIRINSAGILRHRVRLIREYSEVPDLMTDRHKILQILVNLLSNAKYALEAAGDDKRLTIRVALSGKDRVMIAVIDNGVGIAPGNLTRIFQHGFTTKQDGHGFGLHSGALAAKELGGSLQAGSDGIGQGAVFTLELPLQSKGGSG